MAITLGLKVEEGAQPSFKDAKNHWASKYIAAVEKAGVVRGDGKENSLQIKRLTVLLSLL